MIILTVMYIEKIKCPFEAFAIVLLGMFKLVLVTMLGMNIVGFVGFWIHNVIN